jgi:TolB-like protein/Flp pilus assembly protein TadD
MFTDMVGYTALGQKNEELSLALVEEQKKLVRPSLTRHNGREVKTMGDAFLVEFPSALDAIRCAYDIQRATREFNVSMPEDRRIYLRLGIHLGDVLVSGGDISGDAVNIASRIESLADDGGVCITRQVYDQVGGKFELPFVSLGMRPLKNVGDQLEIFKMVMPWSKGTAERLAESDSRRIAVLPFANMSPDPNDEYFADGMTEELISSLSGLSALTVIARTSVMKYKSVSKGASEIAKELGAGTLVEGSVRKSANRVRITVQLIDARNEGHLWAQNYDRQLDDIFSIQSDIAKQVVEALQVKLLGSESKRIDRMPTKNIEAYTLYLKGKYYANRGFGRSEALRRAIAICEEAIVNDPKFALAYAYVALCYNQLGFFGMAPSKEVEKKAREYAQKAIELDNSLAEAHHVVGRILRNYDWDFKKAEKEFDRAIELNPNFVEAYGARALMWLFDRRFDDAIRDVKRALELDPLSGEGASYAGTAYLYSGRSEDAIVQFKKILEDSPGNAYATGNIGLAHVRLGSVDVGLEEVRSVATMDNPSTQSDLAFALGKAGRTEELRALLAILLREVDRKNELSAAVASAYANLGEGDQAIRWLERAYEARLPYMVTVNSDFIYDGIRSDPRFQSLMKKMGWTNTT